MTKIFSKIKGMRQIIFRGKRVRDGEWVYGDFFISHDDKCYIVPQKLPTYNLTLPETIGQYTGISCGDQYGIWGRLFEGDIIINEDHSMFVVKYDFTSFKAKSCAPRCLKYFDLEKFHFMRKIGNEYDNKDLIERWQENPRDIREISEVITEGQEMGSKWIKPSEKLLEENKLPIIPKLCETCGKELDEDGMCKFGCRNRANLDYFWEDLT